MTSILQRIGRMFFEYLGFISNFEHFQEKDTFQSLSVSNIIDS